MDNSKSPIKKTSAKTSAKVTRKTVRIDGVRTVIKTRNGKVTLSAAPVLEIDLQAAAVKQLKRMPQYVFRAEDCRPGTFTLAADQNGSGFRGRNAAVKLKAAGMAAGEPDLRCYFYGGVLRGLEFKGELGSLTESQERRFPLLRALGFPVDVIEAKTEDEAAAKAVALMMGWLATNAIASDNDNSLRKSLTA